MEKKTRTHRVGSFTTGLSMIVFGSLFLIHLYFPQISYETIFRLWPFLLISLGAEVLLSNYTDRKFVYDRTSIVLMIVMTFFSMCMAGADLCFQWGMQNYSF